MDIDVLSLGLFGCMFVSLVFAQRGGEDRPSFKITGFRPGVNQDEPSSFRITDYNSRGDPRGNGRGNSAGGRRDTPADRFNSGRDQPFPNYVRIEIDVQKFDNPQGKLATGKNCDVMNACDTQLNAYLDVSNPSMPFPGSVPVSKWATIFSVNNANSPTIGKVVTQDLCGGATNNANLRVRVTDVDDLSGNDEIGSFNCIFPVNPDLIDTDALAARWTSPKECESTGSKSGSRLFTRMRAYQIPSTSCRTR